MKIFLFAILLLAANCTNLIAQTLQIPSDKERIEAAKAERKLVWYTGLLNPDAKRILDSFQKKYPFIEATFFRSSAEAMINRVLTEDRAGRSAFDVANNSTLVLLQKRGLLQPYLSPEIKNFRPGFFDPQGYWSMMYGGCFVIAYNTKLVSRSRAPRNWEDLLRPEWQGKIGMDKEEWLWYGAMLDYWGENRAKQFMKALAKQKPHWRKGHALINQLMAAGEFHVGITYPHLIDRMVEQGAPVEWIRTTDPILTSMNTLVVPAKTNSPNAARLFVDFVLGSQIQGIIRETGRVPGRHDMLPEEYKKLKLHPIAPKILENLERYATEFSEIFEIH